MPCPPTRGAPGTTRETSVQVTETPEKPQPAVWSRGFLQPLPKPWRNQGQLHWEAGQCPAGPSLVHSRSHQPAASLHSRYVPTAKTVPCPPRARGSHASSAAQHCIFPALVRQPGPLGSPMSTAHQSFCENGLKGKLCFGTAEQPKGSQMHPCCPMGAVGACPEERLAGLRGQPAQTEGLGHISGPTCRKEATSGGHCRQTR